MEGSWQTVRALLTLATMIMLGATNQKLAPQQQQKLFYQNRALYSRRRAARSISFVEPTVVEFVGLSQMSAENVTRWA